MSMKLQGASFEMGGFPLLMISIIFITVAAVLVILVGQELGGILQNLVVAGQRFNQPSPYLPGSMSPYQGYMSFFLLEYNADIWIPFFFIMANIAIIMAGAILNSSLKGYAIGFFGMIIWLFMAFIFSNSAHTILAQNIFAGAVLHLPQTITLLANLGLYEWVFMLIYLLAIAARAIFFRDQSSGGNAGADPSQVRF